LKGIDDVGNGNGLLQATVTGGLHVGIYRVCTMIAPRNHQPVNMPDAQRGAQDDCTKFEVVAAAGNAKASATAGKKCRECKYRQNVVWKVDGKAADHRYSM
jgi:transcription initiation factor TFIID subunit 15